MTLGEIDLDVGVEMPMDESATRDWRDSRPFTADRARRAEPADDIEVGPELEAEFKAALDLNNWTTGERIDLLAERLERDVERAARNEGDIAPRILKQLKQALATAPDRCRESGIYQLTPDHVTAAIRNVLFNGNVEACDGTRIRVATLPITVMQIGICLASYQATGQGGSIVHRLYRQDLLR